jgi:hypothetical protein
MRQHTDIKSYLLHIFALNGFAIAQPVFDLLGDNADFFIARGSQSVDLIVLAMVLVFGLSIVMTGVYALLSVISRRALLLSHQTMVAVLVAIILLPVTKKLGLADGLVLALAGMMGVLFSFAYHRLKGLRLFVSALSPLSLIFASFFVFGSAAKELRQSEQVIANSGTGLSTSDTPVVVVIFDEFALTALMDAERNIDKTVFPNFHKLSENANWYRNATTVATSTMLAVPGILTGNYPKEFISQSFLNYPDTLFTMLAKSHRMNVFESTTTLCSPELCTDSVKLSKPALLRIKFLLADVSAVYLHILAPASLSSNLPVINMTWENYWQLDEAAGWNRHNYGGRLTQLQYFVDSISKTSPPGLHLVHSNFPHVPYQYLPSGSRYQGEWELPGLDFSKDQWGENQWLITQAYQRFLLQAATADLFIGDLLEHLRSIDIYDESMIIITADHGVSFHPNSNRRDAPPLSNLARDVLPVPLFIKYPHQTDGNISDENVETIDILPSIADVLGVKAGPVMDGRSLLGSEPLRPEKLAFHAYDNFLQFKGNADGEAKYETLKWKQGIFENAAGLDGLYKIGKYAELSGASLESLATREVEGLQLSLNTPALYTAFDQDDGFIPSRISGDIKFNDATQDDWIAISINGIVQAVTQLYSSVGDGLKYSAMVPEQSFLEGNNSVVVLLVSDDENGRLELLTEPGQLSRNPGTDGLASWVLEDDRIIGDNGEMPIVAAKLKGNLEYATLDGGTVEFFGWAMDVAQADTVDSVMIFEDGQYVYSNTTGMPRGEGELNGAPNVFIIGFQFIIPAKLFKAAGKSEIRLFAISKNGYATELDYFEGYDWINTN